MSNISDNNSDELFLLIQSLSAQEKRYFKVWASGAGGADAQYIQLYDYLAAQEKFDKEKLTKKFKNTPILKHYSRTKQYLTENILAALRAYYAGKSGKDALQAAVANARILQQKRLLNDAESLLQKTKVQCYEQEEYSVLLDALDVEVLLMHDAMRPHEHLSRERKDVLDILREIHDLAAYNARMLAISYRDMNPNTTELKNAVQETFESLLMQEGYSFRSKTAQSLQFSTRRLCHILRNERAEAAQCSIAELDIFRSSPSFARSRGRSYLLCYGNTVASVFNTLNASLFNELFDAMTEVHDNVAGEEHLKFEQRAAFMFLKFSINRDYSAFTEHVAFVESEPRLLANMSFIRQTDVLFNITIGYYNMKMWEKALLWLNRFLAHPRIEERRHAYVRARMVELMIHIELFNVELLIARALSLRRFLKKAEQLGAYEQAMLNFITVAAKGFDRNHISTAVDGFVESARTLVPNDGVRKEIEWLISWLEERKQAWNERLKGS